MVATVDAWNKASLSGDLTDSMSVSFLSTTKSGGRVSANQTAELIVHGLPASTVSAVRLVVHSNQTSGAGTVLLSLASQSWLVASDDYTNWPGISGYSTSAQTLSALPSPVTIPKQSQLKVYIVGTENSVYLDRVEVDYTPTPPTAHTLRLQWRGADGTTKIQSIQEPIAGEGVLLPAIDPLDSVKQSSSDTWTWLGWCRTELSRDSESPNYFEQDDWFMLDEDCTLYALYSNASTTLLQQDSSFSSGEYALCYVVETFTPKIGIALAGSWQSSRIPMEIVALEQQQDGHWIWPVQCVPDSERYVLTFLTDSVHIYHPVSQQDIGTWAWKSTAQGTIMLYNQTIQDKNGLKHNELTFGYENQTFYAMCHKDYFDPTASYWRLFPTEHVAKTADIHYTTFLDWYPSSLHPSPLTPHPSSYHKYLDANGRLIIQNKQYIYNLLGQPL